MLEINGKNRFFEYKALKAKGKCCVCAEDIPKETKKVIRIHAGQTYASICPECCEILNEISKGYTYGYGEEWFS